MARGNLERSLALAKDTARRIVIPPAGRPPERMMEIYMTTLPFNRHPARPILDLILWIVFLITAILALLMVLGIVGKGAA